MATDIRLRCPEAFPIHQRVIDWQRAQSPDRIPARAVGLAGASLPMLRWALGDWSRMQRVNRLGTWATAAQLDLLPGLGSSGFVVFRWAEARSETSRPDHVLDAGQAIQRFWLTATRLGLVMQPTLAMLAFAEYGQNRTGFTAELKLRRKAEALAGAFRRWLRHWAGRGGFCGPHRRPACPPAGVPIHAPAARLSDRAAGPPITDTGSTSGS